VADTPPSILMSRAAWTDFGQQVAGIFGERPWRQVVLEACDDQTKREVSIALITRDVTGRSTKHVVGETLAACYEVLRASTASKALRWVHTHSAGADRPIYPELRAQGVQVSTSSGANAPVVAQSAIAGILSLLRRFPALAQAQREHRWAPLPVQDPPPDLMGQCAVVVGWGPTGRRIAQLLQVLGVRVKVVRHQALPAGDDLPTFTYGALAQAVVDAHWLVLVCPLSADTRGLVDARVLSALPRGAHLINVARGEVLDDAAFIEAIHSGHLAGAHLDVFHQEPLPAESPLWDLPNVILTPHCAGHSQGNAGRVRQIFLDNLQAWVHGQALRNAVS